MLFTNFGFDEYMFTIRVELKESIFYFQQGCYWLNASSKFNQSVGLHSTRFINVLSSWSSPSTDFVQCTVLNLLLPACFFEGTCDDFLDLVAKMKIVGWH